MNEGIIRVDIKRMMTRIMKAVEFKTDPNMRQELLAAFKEDIKAIISKYDHKYEIFEEDTIEEDLSAVTPDMVGGMGDVVLPNGDTPGSGDVPAGQGKAKKKKKKGILALDEFIQEQEQLKAFEPEQGKGEKLGEGDYEVGPSVDPDDEFRQVAQTRRTISNVVTFNNFRP